MHPGCVRADLPQRVDVGGQSGTGGPHAGMSYSTHSPSRWPRAQGTHSPSQTSPGGRRTSVSGQSPSKADAWRQRRGELQYIGLFTLISTLVSLLCAYTMRCAPKPAHYAVLSRPGTTANLQRTQRGVSPCASMQARVPATGPRVLDGCAHVRSRARAAVAAPLRGGRGGRPARVAQRRRRRTHRRRPWQGAIRLYLVLQCLFLGSPEAV